MYNHLFRKFDFANNNDESFRAVRLSHNIIRMRTLAIFLIFYEIWLGIINIAKIVCNSFSHNMMWQYAGSYLIMLFLSVSFLWIFRRKSETYSNSIKKISKYEAIIWCYVFTGMLWGSIVSLLDQAYNCSLNVYMICTMCYGVLYLAGTMSRIVLLAVSSAVQFLFLPYFQVNDSIATTHYFNICIFVPIVFLAGQMFFNLFRDYYENKQMLKKSKKMLDLEMERNNTINSQLTEANRMLRKLLSIDELTGISNRRGLRNFLEISLDNRTSDTIKLSVIMIDVDFFKTYNDSHGHISGDEVLRAVARELSSVADDSKNFVARYGGEEFIYVSFDTDEKEIYAIAERCRKRVQDLKIPHKLSTVSQYVTISLGGFSSSVSSMHEIDICINKADKALYLAKQNGRNCFCYYR